MEKIWANLKLFTVEVTPLKKKHSIAHLTATESSENVIIR